MRLCGLLLALAIFIPLQAGAGELESLRTIATVSATGAKEISLAPGALGTLSLKSPARSLVIRDGAIASGYISGDVVAIINARAPGHTTIDIRNPSGETVESIELNVRRGSNDAASALPLGPGPTFSHTPSRLDLLTLMGPGFSLQPASFRKGAIIPAASEMETEGRARPPVGWRQFCTFYPEECDVRDVVAEPARLSPKTWQQLLAVNSAVDRRIKPISDMEHHGIVEHWDYPMDGLGDCEDYALLKRRLLIEAGWPRSSVLMTVVRDQNGDGHAVLTVTTDRGDFVLDNQVTEVLPWTATGYRFVKRQSGENPNAWVSLNNVDSAVVAFSSAAKDQAH